MKQVDFYIMNTYSFSDSYLFTCQLTEKAFRQGLSVTIQTTSQAGAQALNELLWSFRDDSFIPHVLLNDPNTENVIIQVHNQHATNSASLLINLRLNSTPEVLESSPPLWERLLQIVPQDPGLLPLARQHYRHYQKLGYEINTHQIQA